MSISVVSLFFEDIRTDQNGSDILIGSLGDIAILPSKDPVHIPKLCVITRINFEIDTPPKEISVSIQIDNNDPIISTIPEGTIEDSLNLAVKQKVPLAGIKANSIIGLNIVSNAEIKAFVTIDGNKILTGYLRFEMQSNNGST